jgi:hypothetical protein
MCAHHDHRNKDSSANNEKCHGKKVTSATEDQSLYPMKCEVSVVRFGGCSLVEGPAIELVRVPQ